MKRPSIRFRPRPTKGEAFFRPLTVDRDGHRRAVLEMPLPAWVTSGQLHISHAETGATWTFDLDEHGTAYRAGFSGFPAKDVTQGTVTAGGSTPKTPPPLADPVLAAHVVFVCPKCWKPMSLFGVKPAPGAVCPFCQHDDLRNKKIAPTGRLTSEGDERKAQD